MEKPKFDLKKYVISHNGSVDKVETLKKFERDLAKFIHLQEENRNKIANAIHQILTDANGHPVLKGSLIPMVVYQKLQASSSSEASRLSNMTEEFINEHSGNCREDGKLFRLAKGINGGIQYWSDYVE